MSTRASIAWILSPLGILLISAGRLIVIANFNTTTAVTIATSGGLVNTLLGTVIPLVPVFIPYLALLLLLFRRFLLSLIVFAFAAFISPTSITLPQALSLAKADWHQLAARAADFRTPAIVSLLVILALLWAYNRSFAEAASIILFSAAALALFFALPRAHLPVPLRLASANDRRVEHRVVAQVTSYGIPWHTILVVLTWVAIGFVIVFIVLPALSESFESLAGEGVTLLTGVITGVVPWLLGVVVAVAATVALFPYVHYIYPAPQHRNYYVEAAHAMWLPAEKIVLKNRHIYYGYVLTSDVTWFTVLLAESRTITYLHTDDVVSRSVCQPIMPDQPQQYPPLIPWLYHPPPALPACPPFDGATLITPFLSKGQPLSAISAAVHVTPWHIITVTNAYHHEQLPAVLRRYERTRDWNAPTPVGVYFWYYPPATP
ncbi:MAG TPA: hypothetical protein VIX86_09295 [Streptosporangiaceae bacterium]